ncbi:hypothetical protein LTR37_004712 [Vermiconidia calcicola]|uniref:Uncharacterized protein n=1 Tax=Vermiconidia calcicola TaxID=1690605 RepID=A0ACC3NM05_9PEZI|nr:hypothetical protein LTR37_004712 [Vermiconidia calcicola]
MDNSPLAKLPAELRNRIYLLALRNEQPIIVVVRSGGRPQEAYRRLYELRTPQALTLTCKQIRNESINMFYSANAFDIRTSTKQAALCLTRFCSMIRETDMKALRSITLSALTFKAGWNTEDFLMDFVDYVIEIHQASKRIPNSSITAILEVREGARGQYSKVGSFNLDMRDLGKPWTATCEQIEKAASEQPTFRKRSILRNTREKIQWYQQHVQIAEAEEPR